MQTPYQPPYALERGFKPRGGGAPMRALLETAFDADTMGNTTAEKTELVVRLMLHELTATAHAPTFLPMPTSAAGQRIAAVAASDYRNALGVDEVAARAATSVRTLSRLFMAEPG